MSGQNDNQPPIGGGNRPLPFAAAVGSLPLGQAVPSTNLLDAPGINFTEVFQYASAPPASPYTAGNSVTVDPQLANRLANFNDTLKYPVRAGLRLKTGKSEVLTNYFEVNIDRNAVFYEYQVVNIPASESRAGKKRYMETAIRAVPFLNNNQNQFATDNISTIFSWIDLHQHATGPRMQNGHPTTGIGAEWRLVDVVDRNTTAYLNLQYVRQVDLDGFRNYADTNHTDPTNYDSSLTENALNTIMTKCINSNNTLHLNKHKFYVRNAFFDLSTNEQGAMAPLRAMRGYSYRIKPAMGNILLNVSPANSAFWRPLLVSEVLQSGCRPFGSTPHNLDNVKRALKNVRVYIDYDRDSKDRKCKHPKCKDPKCKDLKCRDASSKNIKSQGPSMDAQHSRIKTIRGFGLACNAQKFTWDHKDAHGHIIPNQEFRLTVQEYQRIQYGRSLHSPQLPAVNVGTALKPTWFAPEDLRIIPDQIYAKIIPDQVATHFHRQACRPPGEIRSRIEQEGLAHIPTSISNQLDHCPPISLNPVMLQIPSVRLPYPRIMYTTPAASKVSNDDTGRWDLRNTQFLGRRSDNIFWKLITGPGVHPTGNSVQALTRCFDQQLQATGVCLQSQHLGDPLPLYNNSEDMLDKTLKAYLSDHDNRVPDIVVLLLQTKNQNLYSSFKYLTDKIYVLQSICITEANLKHKKGGWYNEQHLQQYMANVAMKANLKRGAINHSAQGVAAWLSNTLVLGADVTHPGSRALQGTPSIAAVVGSLEANGGRFLGIMQLQPAKQEIIVNLGNLVSGLLRFWYSFHEKLPDNILYYRDGVSTSQYDAVIETELSSIKAAFKTLAEKLKMDEVPDLKMTAVIVTKRHSTRFFPRQDQDAMKGNNNCKPGLLVDNIVTSPYFTDFYLQSHNGIKGTARPCHYFVLRNEMAMTTGQLQDLTHNLCHTYVRATMGVSYASPAYYADRLCERGRCYLRAWYNPDNNRRNDYDRKRRAVEEDVETKRDAANAHKPPRLRHQRKTDVEIQEEKEDAAKILEEMRDYIKPKILERWQKSAAQGVPQARWEDWRRTMYWM